MTRYHVVWKGPIHLASGLGIASREYVRALRRQGVRTTAGSGKNSRQSGKGKSSSVLIYHYPPHTLNVSREKKRHKRVILNSVWETTRIPDRWARAINRFDAVFVPSRQNIQAMRNSGVRVPMYIVPHGVNAATFNPRNRKLQIPNTKGKFVFVSVFGFQHRKNPEALFRAYWEAFSASDNVHLVVKTNGYSSRENQQWIRNRVAAYKKKLGIHKRTAPVTILARHLTQRQLRGIYTLGNAFVLPTRGEGVGLPFLESMASGTPVIATGWGGHMDFLTSRNSFFVKYKLTHPFTGKNHVISRSFRSLFSGRAQLWAEADLGSLKQQMRLAYQNRALCRRKGQQGRRDARRLSWNRVGIIMKNAVDKVSRR